MHSKDKISKASWNHFLNTKDVVSKNVVLAIQGGSLKVDQDVIPVLLSVINNSFDEGYHRGHRTFEREVSAVLKEENDTTQLSTVTSNTKKKLVFLKKFQLFLGVFLMSSGLKHLIRCRCVLPQFKNLPEPPVHQFVVFSIIDDSDNVKVKFSQCNNCGVIHKVIDICKSEIIQNKEEMGSLLRIDDIRGSLPENLTKILDSNSADLPTWEAAQFFYENKMWGNFVLLNSDIESGTRQGKYLQILGDNLFKVATFSREEYTKL